MALFEPSHMAAAVRNLLFDCAGFNLGADVLVCFEAAELGWYDAGLAQAVSEEAARQGMNCTLLQVGAPDEMQHESISSAVRDAQNVVYFARIGDHDRFGAAGHQRRGVMVYARNFADFTSMFGRTAHMQMMALKRRIDAQLTAADEIEIRCPRGTHVRGNFALSAPDATMQDTSIRRFPLGVPAPVPADGFYGKVALYGALTPTGNSAYDPSVLLLQHQVMAIIEAGRIADFEGPADEVARIRHHYEVVADKFNIEPFVMHSWHAGIHPSGPYFEYNSGNIEYWSNTVFCNPRLLHFHTCGRFAPGEITWNILDATVIADDKMVWNAGKLVECSV